MSNLVYLIFAQMFALHRRWCLLSEEQGPNAYHGRGGIQHVRVQDTSTLGES